MTTRSGPTKADVVKAYRIARDVSNAKPRWEAIEQLVDEIDLNVWFELMTGQDRVVASLTRRYLARLPKTDAGRGDRGRRVRASPSSKMPCPRPGPTIGGRVHRAEEAILVEAGVPVDLARRHVFRRQLVHAPNAIDLAKAHGRKVAEVAEIMFHAGRGGRTRPAGRHRRRLLLHRLVAAMGSRSPGRRHGRDQAHADQEDPSGCRRPSASGGVWPSSWKSTPGRSNGSTHSSTAVGPDQPENLAPLMIGIRQLRALIG